MLTVRSITDLNAAIIANLHRLDRRQFDCVVGIPRSGMIPAAILSTQLQLPLSDVESFARGTVYGRSGKPAPGTGARVLLVDDTSNKGGAMRAAVARIRHQARAITRFAVFGPYQVADPTAIVDLYCEIVPGPRAFEWNMPKHARLNRWCLDFDGVLCRDPTNAENDDGRQYDSTKEAGRTYRHRQIGKIPRPHDGLAATPQYRGRTAPHDGLCLESREDGPRREGPMEIIDSYRGWL